MNQELIFEVILSFLYLVPISFFRYAPFMPKFRFSTKLTVIFYFTFFFLLNGILLSLGLYNNFADANRARFALYFFMTLFSFLLVKDHFDKQLFVICFYANFSLLFSSACLLLEYFVFGRYSSSIIFKVCGMVILLIPALPLMYQFSYKMLSSILLRPERRIWNILWIIGLIQLILTSALSIPYQLDTVSTGHNAVIRLTLSISSILINHIIVFLVKHLMEANDAKNAAESEKQQLLIQQYQYQTIQEQIENSRRFRHDFKHHSSLISSIANDVTLSDHEKLEQLTKYCKEYFGTIPDAEELHFCDHYSMNLLLNYYYCKAQDINVHFSAQVKIPSQLAIKDTDLCIIIGNLLLNAIEGVATAPKELKHITLTIVKENRNLLIVAENGFDGQINRSGDIFYSTKHPGTGIGIINIRNIASRYKGTCYFENKKQLFSARIHLILDY